MLNKIQFRKGLPKTTKVIDSWGRKSLVFRKVQSFVNS